MARSVPLTIRQLTIKVPHFWWTRKQKRSKGMPESNQLGQDFGDVLGKNLMKWHKRG